MPLSNTAKLGGFVFFATVCIFLLLNRQTSYQMQLEATVGRLQTNLKSLSDSSETRHGLAYAHSFGFFTDILDEDWLRLQRRHHDTPNCFRNCEPERPSTWYQNNFEPTLTCLHERRVGGMGDGPKWVCDPHRIDPTRCLVYSIGSNNKFEFEESVLREISERCEIHTFDPTVGEDPSNRPANVHFHPWGLAASNYVDKSGKQYKTIASIVQELNHAGRRIDLFKIDCEGCEFVTVDGWFGKGVDIGQILVEVHGATNKHAPGISSFLFPFAMMAGTGTAALRSGGKDVEMIDERGMAKNFLEKLQQERYVVFHKEPNIIAGGGCIEYSLIRLDDPFFVSP